LGQFDVVVSALAIHHLPDERKRGLFSEVFELLRPNGAFYDLDVVAAPTAELHALSQAALGFDYRQQDPSDRPAHLEDQLSWLAARGGLRRRRLLLEVAGAVARRRDEAPLSAPDRIRTAPRGLKAPIAHSRPL
jgi:SAM-dependent methyltransferase